MPVNEIFTVSERSPPATVDGARTVQTIIVSLSAIVFVVESPKTTLNPEPCPKLMAAFLLDSALN